MNKDTSKHPVVDYRKSRRNPKPYAARVRGETRTVPQADTARSPAPQVVGATLREQRRRLDLTLEEVATRVGITKGFLSEIERDKAAPSVSTLMKLRDALSLSVASMFRSSLPRVVRAGQRQATPLGGLDIRYLLLSAKDAHRMTIVWGEIAPGGQSGEEPHTLSSDEEIILVLSGCLEIQVDDSTHVLRAGDAFTFDPRRPHRYENPSRKARAVAVCMIAPPPK
jgi:transcriptional regulator with XRE-family HTH domain